MQTTNQTRLFETTIAVIRIATCLLGVYWLAIFVATHLPGSSLPSLGSDKLYHLGAYGGLGFLLSWALTCCLRDAWGRGMVVLGVSIAYALFDEWSQQFVAGRHADGGDAVADVCGAALGVIVFGLLRTWLARESFEAKELN